MMLVLLAGKVPEALTVDETITRNVKVVQAHLALMAANAPSITSSVHLDPDFSVVIDRGSDAPPIAAPLPREDVAVIYEPLKIDRMKSAHCSHVNVGDKIDPSLIGCEISIAKDGQSPQMIQIIYKFNGPKIGRIALVPFRSSSSTTNSLEVQ